MRAQILLYTYNNGERIKKVIDTILSLDLFPVVINDGSSDNTEEILRKYHDSIDVLTFEVHRGFHPTMLSGFRNILRGSHSDIIITMNLMKDNPFYIKQLLETYKLQPKDIYIIERINTDLSFLAKIFRYIFMFFSNIFFHFSAKDHLSTFALFKTSFLKNLIELRSPFDQFLLVTLYLKAGRNNEYAWIPVDETKNDSFWKYFHSFRALF